jgi:MFS family permease
MTASILTFTLSGLIGLWLAPDPALATLSLSLSMIAAGLSLVPLALIMKRFGQGTGFAIGAISGFLGAILACLAIYFKRFDLFLISGVLIGIYQASSQYYRFAAADNAPPEAKSKALSWVLVGGVLAAFTGSALAKYTTTLLPVTYLASFAATALLAIVALGIAFSLRLNPPIAVTASVNQRPLNEVLLSPKFLTALTVSCIGNGLMVMIMTATPLAMHMCGFGLSQSAQVIQWHVLGMFLPSFFTGHLIARFGVKPIITLGILCMFTLILVANGGLEEWRFILGLMLLGVGWNFMYIGGSTLLTLAYEPQEREKVQAAHDFILLVVASVASLSAGAVLSHFQWNGLNLWAIPFLIITLGIVWIRTKPE